jgi:Trk K+ transport system NAD-binding subunit
LAATLLASVMLGGTLGYVVVENWSAWDAFYMTVITVTTVGYREVRPVDVGATLRQRYGVIVGIQRCDRSMEFNPGPDTAIRAGDKLVVLGRPESLKRLEAETLPS